MSRKQQKDQRARWICNTQRTAAAAAVAACFSAAVLANPVNPTVVHGTASFAQSGNILNITNSPNAIINWGSFSIGVNELTRFIQQSGSSAVLNRVIGQDPSAILGALQSNGRVFIINPNGIVFGANAQINVAGLVASTLNLSNEDFLNNRMKFTDGAGAGSVVNQGSITGGSVYLIGKAVSNDGLITSPNGEVILAAGNSVELVNPGTPNLRVEVVAPDNEARNLGTVTADAGRIGIYAGLIQQSGTLRADSAVVEGGRIVLKATKNVHLAAASHTSAGGTSGGTVDIQAGNTTIVEGDIAATGSAGAGGTVKVLGNLVGLVGQAGIDVSGDTGGGTVLVGGDYQGKNPEVQNAFRTYVGPDVTIKADAITEGDGGKVIVWADDVTRYYGDISARGGANGGDGGFAEVSGKRVLDFLGTADLGAAQGATGTLLLDPENIDIQNGPGGLLGALELLIGAGGFGDGQILFGDASILSLEIDPSVLNASTANIILQANDTINVNDPISLANNNVSLTMQAGGFLNVNGSITTRGGAITLVAGDPGGTESEGALYINQALNTTGGGFTNGANITLSAPISDLPANSVYINANVNAGSTGTVNITGQRLDHVAGTISGAQVNVTTESAGSGDINLSGGNIQTFGGGNVFLESDRNIRLTSGYFIVATGGSVTLNADSNGNDDGAIVINNGIINSESVFLGGGNGYAAGNVSNPAGISITNNSQIIANGTVDIRGMGNAAAGGYGVLMDTFVLQNSSGGTYIEGAGGAGAGNHGVKLNSASIQHLGTAGTTEIFGYGTGTGADGVNLGASSGIFLSGSGDIRVTGSGSGGGRGIHMQGAGTAFFSGTNATQILLNSLSGGMVLDGAVTACQACGSITLKSTAGADATTAALTASGLRVLGAGTFNIDSSSNSLETVAAFLSGGPNLLHVHDQGDLQVGTVTSYDGAATSPTTGVNVGSGAGNIVDLHTVGALTNGGGTVTSGGQLILDAASIGATGMGNYMSINRGATGTASLSSSSGGIFVEQAPGSGNLLTSSYTISAPSGQTVALASSGGTLIVNGSLNFALNDLQLYTTGANDIQFNAGAPGTITAASLTLEPAAGRSVLFNSGVTPWDINAPVTVGNNAALDISGGQTVNFNGTFDSTGPVSVGTGSALNFNAGPVMLPGVLNLSGTLGGSADVAVSNVFNWSGGTVAGTGQLITSSTATTNITGSVALAPGKTWGNDGTVNFSGASTLDLGDSTAAIFNNNAGGTVNIASTAGWSFISDPSSQAGQINNAGTISVNNSTSWEAAFNNYSSGVLNIAAGQVVSMQNGKTINGTVNIGAGGTLWVSEFHSSPTIFSGTTIGGTGTLQVLGSGPFAKFTNVSAPGATLRLGGGGSIEILNGTSTFAALNLDSPSYGGAFSINNGIFAQSAGDLIVPSNSTYSGNAGYTAQGGNLSVSGLVNAAYGGANISLEAVGDVKILGGGDVSGAMVKLKGANVLVGDSSSSSPASVYATSLLEIIAGDLAIMGGSGANASVLVSSSGALTVSASGDVVLAGGAGSNAWAKLSGNPDAVLSTVGGVIRMDAGSGAGSYAAIESVSPTTIYVTFPNLGSGGYFVNGVEGVVYDAATGTGFIAGGSPAVLNSNLLVTYGGSGGSGGGVLSGDTLEVPTQNLIVALTESTEPPEAEKEKDVFKETEDDKKKDAPLCK